MKTIVPIVLFLVSDALHARSVVTQKTYSATQLPVLLKKVKTDTAISEERAAALLFHDLLNNFRKENNLQAIPWNDSLWLASRNHCVWMQKNNAFTHDQKYGSELYTGADMYGRFSFVVNKKQTQYACAGENLVIVAASGAKERNTRVWEIAEWAFAQWKDSPEHRANMLNEASYLRHGVYFLIDKERSEVWGVDLFARDIQKSLNEVAAKPAPVVVEKEIVVAEETITVAPQEYATAESFSPYKAKKSLLPLIYGGNGKKKEDIIATAALNHAKYLASAKDSCNEEQKGKSYYTGKDARQRVKNAAKTFHKRKYRNLDFTEEIIYIEMPVTAYNEKEVAAKIRKGFDKANKEIAKTATHVGIGIEVKKTRDIVKIWAVRVNAQAKPDADSEF